MDMEHILFSGINLIWLRPWQGILDVWDGIHIIDGINSVLDQRKSIGFLFQNQSNTRLCMIR